MSGVDTLMTRPPSNCDTAEEKPMPANSYPSAAVNLSKLASAR